MFPKRREYVRRPPKSGLEKNTYRKLQNSEEKSSRFGVSLPMMAGRLAKITGKVSSSYYTQISQEYIPPNINLGEIFQQDNAPAHNAFGTKVWMAENAIDLLEKRPAQSPDLIIIENICCTLNRRVLKRHPNNIEDLWSACQDELERVPLFFIWKLYHSIPARLNEVVRNHGKNIRESWTLLSMFLSFSFVSSVILRCFVIRSKIISQMKLPFLTLL